MIKGFTKIVEHIDSEIAASETPTKYYSNFIIQRYIENPLLINRRKFDIRIFALFTGHLKSKTLRGYIYEEGYLRTCSREYDLSQFENRLIHLTNDAVQK